MSSDYIYKRVLLKVSGEALNGTQESGYCDDAVQSLALSIKESLKDGLELGIVVGAGNIWRGANGKGSTLNPVTADHMGMLATIMNGLCLKDALIANGIKAVALSSVAISGVVEEFSFEKADRYFKEGYVVVFPGGTGNPFFTTDSAATLRALETGCEVVLKATKVNGIYTADPMKDPSAERYETISYAEALTKQLKIMDLTAFSMASDNKLPIIVFNFSDQGSLQKVLSGDTSIASVVK